MDFKGKTAFVTGSTDGLGRGVARELGALGATLILHGRNEERGQALVAEFVGKGYPTPRFLKSDLSSLAEVRKLAARIIETTPSLEFLINNAGVGGGLDGDPNREVTAEGHELRFGVNYLSCVLLTELLLPLLLKSAPARIVHVASAGQDPIDLDNLMPVEGYDGPAAYRQSKLAQIMYTFELDRRLKGTGVSAAAVHPAAFMDTNMVKLRGMPVKTSVQEGVNSVMNAAVSERFWNKGGIYFDKMWPSRANLQAYDPATRRRLMDITWTLLDLPAQPAA
jgi:NAD(P)-dependent dehydrogenase (short-subunit alcohol dehydrogenase family)